MPTDAPHRRRNRAGLPERGLSQVGHARYRPCPRRHDEPAAVRRIRRRRGGPAGRSEHRPARCGQCTCPLAGRTTGRCPHGDHGLARLQRGCLRGRVFGGARASGQHGHAGRRRGDPDGDTDGIDQRTSDSSAGNAPATRALAAGDDRPGRQLVWRGRDDWPRRDRSRVDELCRGPDSGQPCFSRAVHRLLAQRNAYRCQSQCGTRATPDSAAFRSLRPAHVPHQQRGPDCRRAHAASFGSRLLRARVVPSQLAGDRGIPAGRRRHRHRVRSFPA